MNSIKHPLFDNHANFIKKLAIDNNVREKLGAAYTQATGRPPLDAGVDEAINMAFMAAYQCVVNAYGSLGPNTGDVREVLEEDVMKEVEKVYPDMVVILERLQHDTGRLENKVLLSIDPVLKNEINHDVHKENLEYIYNAQGLIQNSHYIPTGEAMLSTEMAAILVEVYEDTKSVVARHYDHLKANNVFEETTQKDYLNDIRTMYATVLQAKIEYRKHLIKLAHTSKVPSQC